MNAAQIRAHFDRYASEREQWKRRNHYYHETLERLCQEIIPPSAQVLSSELAGVIPGLKQAGTGALSAIAIDQAKNPFPGVKARVTPSNDSTRSRPSPTTRGNSRLPTSGRQPFDRDSF